jgi:hypothetical protein
LRSQGKGPAFVLFNNMPYYTEETLDDYVETNTTAPAHSGVEHTKAGNRRPQRRDRDRDVDVAAEAPAPRARRPDPAEAESVE